MIRSKQDSVSDLSRLKLQVSGLKPGRRSLKSDLSP